MRSGYEGARVLVVGASGFIGRWLCRRLTDSGARSYLMVRNSAEAAGTFRKYGVHGELVSADLLNLDAESWARLYATIRPAITFNLAGYGIDPSERDESLSYRINAASVTAICEAAATWRDASWPGQHLIHTGSALEYGDVGGTLHEDGPARPTTAYGKSKLEGTRIIANSARVLGLRALTARLFTVYGPGEHPGRLMPSLMEVSRTPRPLNLTEGNQQRDFTYVEDVAEGLVRLGLAAAEPGVAVNLATGQLLTVRAFVETAARILGIPTESLRFGAIPVRAEEMEHNSVSVQRLRRIISWAPALPILEGIRKTARFTEELSNISLDAPELG